MSRTPAAFLALLLRAAPLAADGPAVTGAPETVYDWAAGRCATWDIPDTPARAWRAPDGSVRLVAGAEKSRAAAGPDLAHLTRDCRVLYRGGRSPDPGAYDDRVWIHSTWTEDGVQVVALAHVEYHGEAHPGGCHAREPARCWRNALVELRSDDGGQTFARAGLAAALPWIYSSADGRRAGYFNPSNIVRVGDQLYTFFWAEGFKDQRRGACLMRRPVDGGPSDWRAWDGHAFAVRFSDPYREDVADPAAHTCAPLPNVASTISGIVRGPSGTWLAVTPATRDGVSGLWWMTSPDLLSWSEPALLWQAPLLWRRDCAAPAAYAYPSLLDPASRARNFDTVGGAFWLYLVEMPIGPGCTVGPERDLIRLPVSWPSP